MSNEEQRISGERVERIIDWACDQAQRQSRHDLFNELLELHEDWKRLRRAVDLAGLEARVTALELWVRDRESYEWEQRERE